MAQWCKLPSSLIVMSSFLHYKNKSSNWWQLTCGILMSYSSSNLALALVWQIYVHAWQMHISVFALHISEEIHIYYTLRPRLSVS
jgi:hypothetical protein